MPEHASWWREDPDAQRQGFGLILHLLEGKWVVARALAGSPANMAGIKAGDVLHSIGGDEIAASLHHTKLHSVIEALDAKLVHEVALLRGQELVRANMQPAVLCDLFENDAAQNGGVVILSCVSCPTCYPRTSGAAQCSDCPTYNCTTG